MILFFLGPFEKLAGPKLSLELDSRLTLRELIMFLAKRFPDFKAYSEMDSDHELSAHISFLSKGKILRLNDTVQNDDTLHILLPVTGG
jgi:hypothetical protein